jgi:hypothetical protein
MRFLTANFIAAILLVFAGQAFAVEKRPCGPDEQEVIAKDGSGMCIKVYGARPETNERLAYQIPSSARESADTKW